MLRGDALLYLLGDARRYNAALGQWELSLAPVMAAAYNLQMVGPGKNSNPVTKERQKANKEIIALRPWLLKTK